MGKTKAFFRQPTAAQLLSRDRIRVVYGKLNRTLEDISEDETLVFHGRSVPNNFRNDKHFMKHGRELPLKRFRSLREAKEARLRPLDLRREGFGDVGDAPCCGYTTRPYWGDHTLRRYSLVSNLKGAKITAFSHKVSGEEIKVNPYVDAKRVGIEGGEVVVFVPSRTEEREPYEIRYSAVPVRETDNKWGIIHLLKTDHVCGEKRYKIRYKFEDDMEGSKAIDFCAHDSAGYLALCEFLYVQEDTIVPTEMNPFAYPSQTTVDFFDKFGHNFLIKTPEDDKPRKPYVGEMEIELWRYVSRHASEDPFYGRKVQEYKWR